MDQKQYDVYLAKTHIYGRISIVLVLVMLISAPFIAGLYFGVMPDFQAFGKAFLATGIIYLVSSVVEYITYVPMLGAGGSYLAFITGNLINMKIPCAMNTMEITQTKPGSSENEIVSTLSIAVSSLVTIFVLAVGVLVLAPVRGFLENPILQSAFENVVPALFGAMAFQYYRMNMKAAFITLVFMSFVFIIFAPSL